MSDAINPKPEAPRPAVASAGETMQQWALRLGGMPGPDAAEIIAALPDHDAAALLQYLDPPAAAKVVAAMSPQHGAALLQRMQGRQASLVFAAMSPDDRVDLLEQIPADRRDRLFAALSATDTADVRRLEEFPPDTAGGIMTTRVAALQEGISVEAAIDALRQLSQKLEQIYYVYVVDQDGKLVGVLSMRDLILANPHTPLSQIMRRDVVSVSAAMDQEQVARIIRRRDFLALPVIAEDRRLIGLITVDDIVDVADEEATEDIQKLGGSEALAGPYLEVGFWTMVRKRGGWLSALFLGEMLTATAMGHFEKEIARAVVLALFVPLIISSGGNSGSQAATIIVRSLGLAELGVRDWWRVLRRELRTGLVLGLWLGLIGFARVVLWQRAGWFNYGHHYLLLAMTVWASLIGVVTFGSLVGSMFPLILRRLGLDPATSSAPFVATLVDVTGLLIYFSTAVLLLRGTML